MFQRLLNWFNRVPMADPVDRRNAVFMQWLLLFEGFRTPLNKAYMLMFDWPYLQHTYYDKAKVAHDIAVTIDLGTDLLMTLAAWFGIYLIRRCLFRLAVAQYLAVVLGSGLTAYASFGFTLGAASDQIMTVVLALAGLMLGRKALWMSYIMIILTFAIGMASNYFFNRDVYITVGPFGELPSLALDYIQIVVILDLSVTGLRKGLEESNANSEKLRQEMAKRQQAQEQLLHAQKMEAVGRLASGIAHDLNNMLEIILGFTTERDRVEDSSNEHHKDTLALANALEGVELAARRGSAICHKLLNFSRLEVARVETFDAVSALHELYSLLRQSLPESVRLQIETPDAPLPIHFDRSRFELALFNLVGNARDAMPEGGLCTISISRHKSVGVVLSVKDTGLGMSEETRARIFEPFFTTKPPGRGTGLGLVAVHGLIESAGGRIEVDSAVGQGTSFRLFLTGASPNGASMKAVAKGVVQIPHSVPG